ncbi:hypothetical protein JUJ52_03845 [Virgibacillus sp. AGTR]|uniref:hypothetical protein n=1 Tax=Virgibacillus sp. AGTR TaxID=2812055 RepID=UPI001D15FC3A|nr:hypothetical protein [Virgibacillus sp. AGTR]MCC2249092.1 hypothetical protein [Virgibacillus sp. AGTR]
MKKVLAVLFLCSLIFLMIGCSQNNAKENDNSKIVDSENGLDNKASDDQLNDFVKKYNEGIETINLSDEDYELEMLNPHDFGKLIKEKNWYSKKLYESDFYDEDGSSYSILAKYNENKTLNGYQLAITGTKENDQYLSRGIASAVIIINTLQLEGEKYNNKFNEFLDSGDSELTYQDNDYEISFFDTQELGSLFINFDASR